MGTVEQEKEELEVFEKFLKARGLDLRDCTFEKRLPPEPDIFLKQSGRDPLAYELAELADPSFKEQLTKSVKTKELAGSILQDWIRSEELKDKFDDAVLFFHFPDGWSLRYRKKVLPELFDGLLTLEDGFEGDCTEKFQGTWPEIERISIGRGVRGPIFDFAWAGFLGDPLFERLYDKFLKKGYEVECDLELLYG